jgi:hypothetical protein
MKKLIITVLCVTGGLLLVVLCLHLLHINATRAYAPSFLRYETDSDGIVRADFTVTNPGSSFVVVKPRAVPNVSTHGWDSTFFTIPPHEGNCLGLVVTSTSQPWQLTMDYWKVKTEPNWAESERVVAGKPNFSVKSLVVTNSLTK